MVGVVFTGVLITHLPKSAMQHRRIFQPVGEDVADFDRRLVGHSRVCNCASGLPIYSNTKLMGSIINYPYEV